MSNEPGLTAGHGPIPLTVPEIRGREWEYIKECLDTNWVSAAGPFVDRFEKEVAARVGARHAVATVNGTAALHVALLVAGVAPDDEVLVPALTFIAPANTVRYAGAWPVFIDVEPDYWQLDVARVEEFVARECRFQHGELRNQKTGRRVKAILPVHILGHPVDMDPLAALAKQFNLAVIEDATESLGARYKNRPVGTLGDIACFSFNGNKIITAGGGGMIVTDREEWARQAGYLTTQAKDDPLESIHREIGYNYRLTNLQAALGSAQLEQLDDFIAAKRRIARVYEEALGPVPGISLMKEAPGAFSIFWLYTILVEESKFGLSSRRLLEKLSRAGIQTRPLWQPLHLSPAHRNSPHGECPVAERLGRDGLSLPSSVGLGIEDQRRVCQVLCGKR